MSTAERRQRGALEAEVLAALGAAGRPLTPREVRTGVAGEPAYTTVMTTLARLHEKGALLRRKDGRAYSYELAGAPDEVSAAATAHRMRKILDEDADRTVALTRFVSDLDEADERLLARLLADLDGPGGSGHPDDGGRGTGRDAGR